MRLTKSREDVLITGLLGGVGEYLNVDPTIVRMVVAVLTFFTPLPIIPLYFIASLIVPKAPKDNTRNEERARRERMDRAFKQADYVNQDFSSKAKSIDEDDWSDF